MFMISDLPPQMPVNEVRMFCSVESAIHYQIPADLIYAVALNEGGNFKSKVKNTNGTYDLGIMQFNTAYLKTLKDEGINPEDALKTGCYPFHLASWRIKGHISENTNADLFTKVAYYHSRTPKYNIVYRNRLIKNLQKFDYIQAEQIYSIIIERLYAGLLGN